MSSNGLENRDAKDVVRPLRDLFYKDLLPDGSVEITEDFINKIVQLILAYLKQANDRTENVLNFHYPHDLEQLFDFNIPNEPQSLQAILNDCKSILDHAVKTAHPRFFNQFFQGINILSLMGEWLTAVTNSSVYTYEVAPMYIFMENYVFAKLSDLIGWAEPCDGLFSPGGSISNLYALHAARFCQFPEIKTKGIYGLPKLVAFTSQHTHYSIKRALAILGVGTESLRLVPVDQKGRIIPKELDKIIIESRNSGEYPFIVCLTAGTTILGAFDPIAPVADICQKYKIWLHVDAAWGGSAMFSKQLKHLLNGIDRADSVTWNPHKMMGALMQASVILFKKRGILHECNSMNASYLFPQDKFYDLQYDIGDKTIQCGRHVDVCKVWLMWKAQGMQGFEAHVDHMYSLAQYFYAEVLKRKNFEIVLKDPEFANVCFWYIPNSLMELDRQSAEYKKKLGLVAPKIKQKMMLKGSMMITYLPLDNHPNFFRIVFSNAATKFQDCDFTLNEIARLGSEL